MSETPPDVTIEPAGRSRFSGASIIWIIPILALAIALGVAWQTYSARGPLIEVSFENGSGIAAGETELRYRDITVGVVEEVGFTEGLDRVLARIRVDKDVAPYIDNGSVFWIVEPEVTAQGITGLSTVLSGVYIEGSWDTEIGTAAVRFQGASTAPLIRPGRSGLQIAFRTSANGQLTDNAPILFRGIEVGRVGKAQIGRGGSFAVVEALIYEEHRGLINSSTRFWDTSGFEVSFGPQGAAIDFSSLATLVGGGITFDTFVSGGERVQDGYVFEIFPDKASARNSLFSVSEVEPLRVNVVFEENVSGLTTGAPVELSGFKIGEVDALSGIIDAERFGDNRVRLSVTLAIQPARLGLPGDVTAQNALAFLQDGVETGLRARLASASLLTGGLKVELIEVPDAPPAPDLAGIGDLPVLPSTESEVSDAAATVEGVFNRINNLPIEELLNAAIEFLGSAEALISNDDIRQTPGEVRVLLSDLSALVNSEDVQNVPVSLNQTLSRVEGLVAELERQQIVDRLMGAIDSAGEAADAVSASVDGVPALIGQIETLAAKAEALDLESLLAQVTDLTRSADALLGSEDTLGLPGELRTALAEVNAALAALREGGAIDNVNRTLESVDGIVADLARRNVTERLFAALDAAASAADTVTASVEGVPALIAQIQSVAAKADSLELNALLEELTTLTRSADAVIGTQDAVALPGALKGALDELNATLTELREGGAVANVNQTLASARTAADSIAASTDALPDVVDRLTALFDQASRTIEGYNRGDEISRSTQETLREVRQAASALAKLARTIERNPNSLLLGR